MKLLFASANEHKLNEVRALLGKDFELFSLKDISFSDDIPEDHDTMQENAKQKARFIFERTGHDCFADDSGLEVGALNGRPGVYSARYGGEHGNSEKNIRKVLEELGDEMNRRARFRTVICLILKGRLHFFEGTVEGVIATERYGKGGFGYDPIFIPDGDSRSFSEMSEEEKNAQSHRAEAIAKMKAWLTSQ